MSQIVKQDPLHIQAYKIIRRFILEGEFEPGERVIEVKLAEQLGISRAPIREAFRMLIHDGLLIQDEGPILLYKPSRDDIIDVFQCREYLEALAVRLAADNITEDLIDELSVNIQHLKEAIHKRSKSEISSYDQRFHELIIEASGNKQLIDLISRIRVKITYIRNTIFCNYETNIDFADEHARILQALMNKDKDQAEQEMKLHIKSNLDYIITTNKI
ncbi:GntR family transcriptional regulator [Ammoniphilus resinae]|uniref:DNA-binding GntR family transcriptional regulator n=1 Tax=Ammoniphilus resinae TaxID=861532 RepID=A0ABS4GL32_9BACL|nr:GntR family transcriptional regulator [Ammoniphilus resinae]MBP1930954.1 DNA-binding GntR family transcriptional regulator [Ammoniphilus resinae]